MVSRRQCLQSFKARTRIEHEFLIRFFIIWILWWKSNEIETFFSPILVHHSDTGKPRQHMTQKNWNALPFYRVTPRFFDLTYLVERAGLFFLQTHHIRWSTNRISSSLSSMAAICGDFFKDLLRFGRTWKLDNYQQLLFFFQTSFTEKKMMNASFCFILVYLLSLLETVEICYVST